ncbi:Protein kinase-like domain [Pseudocohnilembus persalinus]|uniref:mitogen-activated protein kinase kinase n=1 Tax=Pseudocohnilembus persalinus TaxID=266149 RepID=A0A0V0QK27_PSEPJ|nr:Protein kinase-like domain [Pseudocohnilembus persalinus]|eukprot:KRX02582.1 Protein kinase-like domain [Pseudocohnilembus persalinus]
MQKQQNNIQILKSKFGEFQIIHQLGEGGQAEVYLVQNQQQIENQPQIQAAKMYTQLEKLKSKQKKVQSREEQIIYQNEIDKQQQEIENEYKCLIQLDHLNVIKFYNAEQITYQIKAQNGEIIQQKTQPAIFQEFASNGCILDYLKLLKLEEKEARFFFRQLIQGIQHIHSKGIAHRDIKVDNLFLDDDFNLKIGDLGHGGHMSKYNTGLLNTSERGTFIYNPPEISTGKYVGSHVDIYQAGIFLLICIFSRPPFPFAQNKPKEQCNEYKFIQKHLYEDYWDKQEQILNKSISHELKDLAMNMLQLTPSNRLSISEIIAHPWYNGIVSTQEEIKQKFNQLKQIMKNRRLIQDQKNQIKQANEQKGNKMFCGQQTFRNSQQNYDLNDHIDTVLHKYPSLNEDRDIKQIPFNYYRNYFVINKNTQPKQLLAQLIVHEDQFSKQISINDQYYQDSEGDQTVNEGDDNIIQKNEQYGDHDQVERDLIKQIEKLSLDNKQKTQEIQTKNIISILPTNTLNNFQLKDFKIISTLGKGNSGSRVDKVLHQPTNTLYALKKINLLNDENFTKYLKAEIKALISCESELIVKYHGAIFEEGQVHIVLEYMDKGSLGHLLQQVKTIPETILGVIVLQMLKGLQYFKELKLIHRDIKPQNILINSKGQVKITDFGVCGIISTVDQLNSWVGTTIYMSPERVKQDKYSYDTDIWSLGMTILECVLGYHPLTQINNKQVWELLDQVSNFKVPQLPDTINAKLQDFIRKWCRQI